MHTRSAHPLQGSSKNSSAHCAPSATIGAIVCVVLLGALTGCFYGGPRPGEVYVEPPSVYVESGVVMEPEYVYYPGYQIYYSRNTREYVYRDGRSWVSRPAPPHVSAQVLLASPSVRLNFHDAPAAHHAAVARQYPKNWAPPASSQGRKEGHDEGGKNHSPGRN